jgi:hypothetical protein
MAYVVTHGSIKHQVVEGGVPIDTWYQPGDTLPGDLAEDDIKDWLEQGVIIEAKQAQKEEKQEEKKQAPQVPKQEQGK